MRTISAILAFAAAVCWAGEATELAAQEPSRAGLVISFDGGRTRETCVDLGGPDHTGEELLHLAGLDIVTESGPLGTRVCAIEGVGCPRDDCWCECRNPGAACRYWAYYSLQGGKWQYSSVGASTRTVRHGDVDGWSWGAGMYGAGEPPPVRAFEAICKEPEGPATARTAASTPSATGAKPTAVAPPGDGATPGAAPSGATTPRPAPSGPAPSGATSAIADPDDEATRPTTSKASAASRPSRTPGPERASSVTAATPAGAADGAEYLATTATIEAALTLISLLEAGGPTAPPVAGEPPSLAAPRLGQLATATLASARRIEPVTPADASAPGGGQALFGYVIFALVIAFLGGSALYVSRRG